MRILSKNNDVPATRYERNDHLTFKSTQTLRDSKKELEREQKNNHKFAYESKKWHRDYMEGKVSGINELLHHTGLGAARVQTIKYHDITNNIANL